MKQVEKRSNELFAQFQEEILRKQNEVLKNLESTEKTLLAKVDRNPRLWNKSSLDVGFLASVLPDIIYTA